MSILKKLWWGMYSLPKAFWGFYILGFLGVFTLAIPILLVGYALKIGTIGFIVFVAVVWSYWFIASVGVWRSASASYASPFWVVKLNGIAARVFVLAFAARVFWSLANGGALRLMERMTAPMNF